MTNSNYNIIQNCIHNLYQVKAAQRDVAAQLALEVTIAELEGVLASELVASQKEFCHIAAHQAEDQAAYEAYMEGLASERGDVG